MKHFLAIDTSGVIGTINAPVDNDLYKGEVNASVGKLISTGIQLFFLIAGLTTLIYMLIGAFDWITSNGEKEKIAKAQNKIQSAAIGLVLTVVVFVIFNVLMGTVLGGKFGIGEGLQFTLPSINNP